jgi:PAS domain S-box-containing protein
MAAERKNWPPMRATPKQKIVPRFPLGRKHRRRTLHDNPGSNNSTAEERLRLLLDVAHIIPWEADFPTGLFTYVGRMAERTLGYPISDWYEPRFWETHLHPDDRERTLANCERLSHECNYYELEYRMISKDGRPVWLRSLITVIHEHGQPKLVRGFSIDITESRQTEAALRELGGRFIGAQEKERTRIARELHDDLNQRMALVSIELEQMGQGADSNLRRRFESLQNQVQEISADIHRLSYRLHPSKLDHLGLSAAIRSLCEQLNAAGSIRVYLHQQGVPATLPKDLTLCLFRVAQEALRNAVKHSRARHVRVILKKVDNTMMLSVADDGCGFITGTSMPVEGLGFISMRERSRIAGGQFEVYSLPGQGTRIELTVPLRTNTVLTQTAESD